jgi:hypothetical protein
MRYIVVMALLCCHAHADFDPLDFTQTPHYVDRGLIARRIAKEIGRDLERGKLPRVAARTDEALGNLLHTAIRQLERRGHDQLAAELRMEYGEKYAGFLTRMVGDGRNIGDHKPLSEWLATAYKKIEAALGVTICSLLHLTDLKTINYGIPVVFHPCTYDLAPMPESERMTEYRRHFSGKIDGEALDGLVPVLSYWIAWIACEVATYGGGWFIICSPLATLVEVAEERWITPKLSDMIFLKQCSG